MMKQKWDKICFWKQKMWNCTEQNLFLYTKNVECSKLNNKHAEHFFPSGKKDSLGAPHFLGNKEDIWIRKKHLVTAIGL